MIVLDQLRDLLFIGMDNTVSRKGFQYLKNVVVKNQKTIMSYLPIIIGLIALVTSPVWVTILIFTSPLIIASVLLFMYTNVICRHHI